MFGDLSAWLKYIQLYFVVQTKFYKFYAKQSYLQPRQIIKYVGKSATSHSIIWFPWKIFSCNCWTYRRGRDVADLYDFVQFIRLLFKCAPFIGSIYGQRYSLCIVRPWFPLQPINSILSSNLKIFPWWIFNWMSSNALPLLRFDNF